jgi:hypothetical protein
MFKNARLPVNHSQEELAELSGTSRIYNKIEKAFKLKIKIWN